jgi:hypothetical protein
LRIAIIAQFEPENWRLPSSAEIVDQIDPSLMRLMLGQYLTPLVKDAPLSAHGDASMRHLQEKDAPLVSQGRQR